jgi:hypothetical protein
MLNFLSKWMIVPCSAPSANIISHPQWKFGVQFEEIPETLEKFPVA